MVDIKVEYDSGRKKGILNTDYLPVIREHFSVEDKDQAFKRRYAVGYRPKTRQYIITPQGRFDPRFIFSIIDFLKTSQVPFNITLSEEFKQAIKAPPLDQIIPEFNIPLRDYQKESIQEALANKSGIILLPTSAGKTLVICTLVWSIINQYNLKCLILVPNIQLVTQTHQDFIDYGIPRDDVTMWTGSHTPNPDSKIVVTNVQILQSEKQDLSLLSQIGILVVDEVHVCKKTNLINKIIDQITARYRFGFTGTLPCSPIDAWNIFGKFGKVIYEKKSYDLREQNYITEVKVCVLKLNYIDPLKQSRHHINPTQAYEEEIQFLQVNPFRNKIITNLVNKLDKNTLILVDRIIHGEELLRVLQQNTNKRVYFVHGGVEMEEREEIRRLMETEDDVICIAISKIFSTGINIKNLHNIIFAAIGKAKIKIIQSIGRSLRKHANKKKAIIFDIWDNLKYGNNHIVERLNLYTEEKIEYSVTEIKQS